MALCYSRYLYIEFTVSQAIGTFLRCMDRGLAFFGGVNTVDIFDNMKTVVLSHTPPATLLNRRFLNPIPETPFDTDDIESQGVTKTFRVTFDRNRYSVPWRLVGQTVVVRGNDQAVTAHLGPKQVAQHARSWNIGQDIEHPSHK